MKIKCSSIFKTYHISKTRDVINDLSFELDTGNSLALYGPSGVGKSTLLNILSGLDNPDRERLFIMIFALQTYLTQKKFHSD